MGKARVDNAYDSGFDNGYTDGHRLGREGYGRLMEGTSIIIPTYNKAEYLKLCIDSIRSHTPEPHEIIVVDNASTDDTAAMLRAMDGRVRYRVLPENRGFAGAVNVGLMMAKGHDVLLLNNDTLVTPGWLSNLLACLHSDPGIGMVGPVTNMIGGPQQIEVPYRDAADMPRFAAAYNKRDPGQWTDTDRLVGFCLLMRRELLQRVGYFDEGYRIGNYEDDDFGLRVRLQGLRLVNARDTFIHHYGSVSMKALGDGFMAVNDGNKAFFEAKWEQPGELCLRSARTGGHAARAETAFYPGQTAVQCGESLYWLDGGYRRPLASRPERIPVTPVNRLILRRYAPGEAIAAGEAEERWLDAQAGIVHLQGAPYLLEGGKLRRVAGSRAVAAWGLDRKPGASAAEDELAGLPEGLPVIAPPQTWERL